MINLNNVWIDGRTYRKILNDVLKNGSEVLGSLPKQYLLSYVDNDYDDAQDIIDGLYDEKALQDYANDELDRPYTDDEIDDILLIYSREIDVIYTTVRNYQGMGGYLPGYIIGTAVKSYEFLRKMIDPILYVMQYSSFPRNELSSA